MKEKNRHTTKRYLKNFIMNKTFQRLLIGIITVAIAFAIVENGAVPKKYKLILGDSSSYDITAPRDIENKLLTQEKAKAASDAVPNVMISLSNVPIDVINSFEDFITAVENSRMSVDKSLQDQGITRKDKDFAKKLELEQALAARDLTAAARSLDIPLSNEQSKYLITSISDDDLSAFHKAMKADISDILKQDINVENLQTKITEAQSNLQKSTLSPELNGIGGIVVNSLLKPNSIKDEQLTDQKKKDAYNTAMENRQMITEGSRILSYGDKVSSDKLQVLKELNLLETGKFDYVFAASILVVILMLAFLLVLYMNFFNKKLLYSRHELILLSVIVLLTLAAARILDFYSPLLIPIFIAPILITILLDLRLGIIVNFFLAIAISFITKGNLAFLYISLIGGTFSTFLVSKASQRSRLSASGLAIALVNAAVIVCMGGLNKNTLASIANDAGIVAINGVLSTIFTIGLLPFFESTFNIITPLKLLELANPNQPLIKRLLMEAPGTYHHSLMVGNLAEMATEAIDGNALLARVGAYYHDVGKLKRPNFFKENQLSENPHDRMTPNLSTLVITSHTGDGVEIAERYKIPMAIKDIISQHHGTTLVAYFYYKAKKSDKADNVKLEDFRYEGPRPTTKEAAVVMLADSVEAAVRSMADKTEGKIEGLIRKLIKDKLDDGQLDLCDLTLRDLDNIARAFLRVFSGFFHEREEYPDVKLKKMLNEENNQEEAENQELARKNPDGNETTLEEKPGAGQNPEALYYGKQEIQIAGENLSEEEKADYENY